ncbi:hypothetical protein ON010_g15683 [Phytophthora cinnamomi]|nr:hypothetical protein ON010_g15683 [Phytophthora cinnamomi]
MELVNFASFEQDDLLRDAVRHHGVRHWDYVASAVPNHSKASCSARWDELQTPLTRHPWSIQEDEFLRTFVGCDGASQWAIVGSHLSGRNAKQCRGRWHHQLDPSIKREAWSADEDTLLVTLQRKFGNAWSRMAAYLPGRRDNAIKKSLALGSLQVSQAIRGKPDLGFGEPERREPN